MMPNNANVIIYFVKYQQATSAQSCGSRSESVATDRGSKLLVLNDDAGVRTFLRLSLELEGFSVVEARDGPDALSLLGDDIDACITDLTRPYMDGIELISLVHQIRQDLPVLIISGNYTGQYANRLTGLNWVQKPFSGGEVARRVRELIARSEGSRKALSSDR